MGRCRVSMGVSHPDHFQTGNQVSYRRNQVLPTKRHTRSLVDHNTSESCRKARISNCWWCGAHYVDRMHNTTTFPSCLALHFVKMIHPWYTSPLGDLVVALMTLGWLASANMWLSQSSANFCRQNQTLSFTSEKFRNQKQWHKEQGRVYLWWSTTTPKYSLLMHF